MTSSIKAKLNKLKNPVLSLKVPANTDTPIPLLMKKIEKKRGYLFFLCLTSAEGSIPAGPKTDWLLSTTYNFT